MNRILDRLAVHAQSRPDYAAAIALRPGGRVERITYRDLNDAVARTAAHLRARLAEPVIVPVLAAKNVDCVVAVLAILAAGSAFAVLNRKLKAVQLNAAVVAAASPLGILDGDGAAIASANASEPFASLPWLTIGSEFSAAQQTAIDSLARVERLDFRVESSSVEPLQAASASDAPGCCLFTSGSTGSPKGVVISAGDLDERADAEAELFGLTPVDVLLCVLPFSFDVGLNQLLSSIVAGSTIVLSESWLPVDMLRGVAQFGVTGVSGVPAVWNDLLNSTLRFDRSAAHSTLRYVTVSGGDLPPERLARLPHAIDGAGIFKTYGQSETFRSNALRPADFAAHPTSVGRPFGRAKVYVVRPDGSAAAVGETGEIVHTGPGTMLGYLGGHATNLRPNPFHGSADPHLLAVFTGDTGRLDAEGFLFVHGRMDSMLKVAGNRVYPGEVVNQILALPGVAEAEVVGIKNAAGETRLIAFVVLMSQGESSAPQPAVLRRKLIDLLPAYMVPRSVVLLDSLPKTANGKINRPALLALATSPEFSPDPSFKSVANPAVKENRP